MKIYLASMYSQRDQTREHAKTLRAAGHTVTSTWLRERAPLKCKTADFHDRWLRDRAVVDLEDIDRADAILLFSVDGTKPTVRGGRHVEFGYAMATNKRLFVVGPRENIFHFLPIVKHYDTVEAFIQENK